MLMNIPPSPFDMKVYMRSCGVKCNGLQMIQSITLCSKGKPERHPQQTDIKLRYSFKDLLNIIVKKEEDTTNMEQSHVMISQREMTSFEAMDHQGVPRTTTSKNEANESKSLQISDVRGSPSQYFQEDLTGIRIESKVVELPSTICNGQQPHRDSTETKKPVNEKPNRRILMYSINDILNDICKKEEETTNIEQSHVMISQRDMTSFEAMYQQDVAHPMISSSEADDSKGLEISDVCGSPSQYFQEEHIGIRIESKMSYHQPPFPAYQLDTLSGGSEIMPLYQLASDNEGTLSPNSSYHEGTSPLSSLDTMVETTFGFQVEKAKTDTQPKVTYGGNRSQGFQKQTVTNTLSCPNACPCVCHLPSPFPVLNRERPSVIMAPVARNYRASSVTHTPLQHNEDSLKKALSRKEIVNWADDDSDDSDEEGHLFRVTLDGLKTKFKLTKDDWDQMDVNHFPSGGRLLGGAWISIFTRGVQESNPWCSLRYKNNHVRTENSRKMNSAPFFRGSGECKRRECALKVKFIIKKERGRYANVLYIGNVCHKA